MFSAFKQATQFRAGTLLSPRWMTSTAAVSAASSASSANENRSNGSFGSATGLSRHPRTSTPSSEKIVAWKLYATFHRHNTLCSLSAVVEDLDFMKKNDHLSYNEKVLYYMNLPHHTKAFVSAGMLGFRKGNRAEYEAAYQVSSRLFKIIEEKKLLDQNAQVELILQDFGRGREAFTSALQGKEGAHVRPHIVRVTDRTKLKFGGVRSKKLRRL